MRPSRRATATSSAREATESFWKMEASWRLSLDRDLDGALDGDEYDADTNPADPTSHP